MLKKVLLMIAVMIFAFSCSSPSNPNNGGTGDTGDGSIIDEGSGTSNPTTIADFLNKHAGRYYYQSDNGHIYVEERIENGKIYDTSLSEEGLEITGTMTLSKSDNKLQIETVQYLEPLNKVIYLYTFNNNGMSKSVKSIYMKDPVSSTTGYKQLAKVNGLEKYAGAYYNYYYSSPQVQPEKSINFIIDNNGYIYVPIPEQIQIQIKNITLNGDNLVIQMTQVVPEENGQSYTYNVEQSIILKNNYFIENYTKVNGEYQRLYEYNKSDLLTPYIGDYDSADGNITLMVKSNKPTLIINTQGYSDGILLGNTLTISAYISENNYKKYVILFSDDKQTATYTDPDTQQKVTLTKQGA